MYNCTNPPFFFRGWGVPGSSWGLRVYLTFAKQSIPPVLWLSELKMFG